MARRSVTGMDVTGMDALAVSWAQGPAGCRYLEVVRHPPGVELVAIRPVVNDVSQLLPSTPSGKMQKLEPRRAIGGPS